MAASVQIPARAPRVARRSFTLLELLAVVGMLLALTTLTVVSVTAVTRDANVAAGVNTVVAVLGEARAVALRDNAYVAVAFRVAPDQRARAIPSDPQVIEIIVGKWTGEVANGLNEDNDIIADRFVPVPGLPSRRLPVGVMVAGPAFGVTTDTEVGKNDRFWITQPRFEGTVGEPLAVGAPPSFLPDLNRTQLGWGIGVLFGPEGRMLSRNPEQVLEVNNETGGSASDDNAYAKAFIDLNGDGSPFKGLTVVPPYPPDANVQWTVYDEPLDEPVFDYVPYLAVFSETEALRTFPLALQPAGVAGSWRGSTINTDASGGRRRRNDLTAFIDERGDRIVFNRYSGVAAAVSR